MKSEMKSPFFKFMLILGSLLPNLAMSQTPNDGGVDRPTFVLVHGTFQWGGQWDALSAILKKEGYSVHAPTLTGLGEKEHLLSKQIGLSTHIEDVVNYITWYDLDSVILVAHSYGGAPSTGVVDRLPDRIAHIVYLDAVILKHGESMITDFAAPSEVKHLLEAVEKEGHGWLLPPKFLRNPPPPTMKPHPLKTYIDRIDLKGPPPTSGTFIAATEGELFSVLREKGTKRAKERGWAVHTVEGPHPLQETSPSKEEVAEILLRIARSLKQP